MEQLQEYLRDSSFMPLSHAVRYLATKTPWLNWEEARSAEDFPDLSRFEQAKKRLILLGRRGEIRARGFLDFRKKNTEFHGWEVGKNAENDFDWRTYIEEKIAELPELDETIVEAEQSLMDPIPCRLWAYKFFDFERSGIYAHTTDVRPSEDGRRNEIYFYHELNFSFVGIHAETFLNAIAKQETPKVEPVRNLEPRERQSLMRLVAAMAVRGYSFDPNSDRNKAVTDICSDLDFLGIPLDRTTVLKWLREATKEIPDG